MTELGRDHTKRTAMLVTVVVNMRQSKANTRQMNVIVILPVLFGPATLREAKIKASKRNTMQTFFFLKLVTTKLEESQMYTLELQPSDGPKMASSKH